MLERMQTILNWKKPKRKETFTADFFSISTKKLKKLSDEQLNGQFHAYRGFYLNHEQPKNHRYYSSIFQAARRLIILIGAREHTIFSLRDIVYETYFERANEAPLNGREPREFLEFLIEAKEYTNIEFELDRMIVDVIDSFPRLKEFNFSEYAKDFQFYDEVKMFAARARYSSEINIEGKSISVGSQLPSYLQHIYYDELANFMNLFSWLVLKENAKKEKQAGHSAIAKELDEAAESLKQVQHHLQKAGELQNDSIDLSAKRCRGENIFLRDDLTRAKTGHFVHSYMLTLRMHNETGHCGPYDLLKGKDYRQELKRDADFEVMIVALIEAFDLWGEGELADIEQELNKMINRDVWVFQKTE